MSTSGRKSTEPEPISRQTSTRTNQTLGAREYLFEHWESSSDEEQQDTTESEEDEIVEPAPEAKELAQDLEALTIEEEMPAAATESATNGKDPIGRIMETNPKGVIDPGFFEGERKKFADWWRGIKLYLKINKYKDADEKIVIVTSRMRGDIAGLFARKWADKVTESDDTSDWKQFEKELEGAFQEGNKREIAEEQIEKFDQGKQNIRDYMIKFAALAEDAETDEMHAVFLLKKLVRNDIIRTILGYPATSIPKRDDLKGWAAAITSVGTGYEINDIRIDYHSATGITYGGRGQPMEIGGKKFEWNREGQPKCHKCGRFGHIGRNCKNGQQKPRIKCYNCGKIGHMAKDCRGKKNVGRFRAIRENEETTEEEEEGGETEPKKQGFQEGSE